MNTDYDHIEAVLGDVGKTLAHVAAKKGSLITNDDLDQIIQTLGHAYTAISDMQIDLESQVA